jgi:hypothetical protein
VEEEQQQRQQWLAASVQQQLLASLQVSSGVWRVEITAIMRRA